MCVRKEEEGIMEASQVGTGEKEREVISLFLVSVCVFVSIIANSRLAECGYVCIQSQKKFISSLN